MEIWTLVREENSAPSLMTKILPHSVSHQKKYYRPHLDFNIKQFSSIGTVPLRRKRPHWDSTFSYIWFLFLQLTSGQQESSFQLPWNVRIDQHPHIDSYTTGMSYWTDSCTTRILQDRY